MTPSPVRKQDVDATTADGHIVEAQRLVAGLNSTDVGSALRADVIARVTAHATLALALQGQQAGICDHGNTGVCMSCVIVHDLLRPVSS